jgi:hypothetical protein
VYRCPTYVHVLDEFRKKLNPKSKKCIFVGYGEIFGVNSHKYLIHLFIVCPLIKISYWMKIPFFSNFGAFFHQLKGNVENILFDNDIITIHEDKGFLPLIAITPSFPSLDPPFPIFPNNLIPLQMAPMTPLHYLHHL